MGFLISKAMKNERDFAPMVYHTENHQAEIKTLAVSVMRT
jgi:hypothetical protein